jgi:hypothetical protein
VPVNLAACLLKDFVYQQDKTTNYIFEDDKFILVDRDEIADAMLQNIDAVFECYVGKDDQLSIERAYNPFTLNQALCRYSRDIFGEKRLHAKVLHFKNKYGIQESDVLELINYEDYGLKVDSRSPYVHRRIACLFYWFSVLKPFHAKIKSAIVESENTYAFLEYHNEYITYILMLLVLACVNFTMNIHEELPLFRQFLYDLHYRKLSRSALEFFLNEHIVKLKKAE